MTRSKVLAFIMEFGPLTEADILVEFGRGGETIVKDLLQLEVVKKAPFRTQFEFTATGMGAYSR